MNDTTNHVSKSTGKSFMTDDQGNLSSMRLMSMLALIVAGILAFIEVLGWGFIGWRQNRACFVFSCCGVCA